MYIAVVAVNPQNNSGVKQTREAALAWAKNRLETTKDTRVFVFEAVVDCSVSPREMVTTELKPTEENTKPDAKCDECRPETLNIPKLNGHDPDQYIHDTY